MNWTEEHDSVFCREIIFVNPFSAKKKSVQRSALWQKVADTLNSITDPVFYVDKRSVRDHIGVLVQRFKRKEAKELKESGTNPTKTEVDVAIEQIIAMEVCRWAARPGRRRKTGQDGGRQTESRRNAQDCYGDNGENTEEKVRGGPEQGKEMQKKWEWNGRVSKTKTQNQQRDMFKQTIKQQQEQQKQMHDMQSLLMLQQHQQTTALMKIIETLVPK